MEDEFKVLQDDIHDEGEDTARESCAYAFENKTDLASISKYIKEQFDKKLGVGGGGWNVVIGRDYGAHVVHVTNNYVFAGFRQLYILIWKS